MPTSCLERMSRRAAGDGTPTSTCGQQAAGGKRGRLFALQQAVDSCRRQGSAPAKQEQA